MVAMVCVMAVTMSRVLNNIACHISYQWGFRTWSTSLELPRMYFTTLRKSQGV